MPTTFYEVRSRDGALVAIHKRIDRPDGGKDVIWLRPDGSRRPERHARRASCRSSASHRIGAWTRRCPSSSSRARRPRDALQGLGIPAVGTVTGAAGTPSADRARGPRWPCRPALARQRRAGSRAHASHRGAAGAHRSRGLGRVAGRAPEGRRRRLRRSGGPPTTCGPCWRPRRPCPWQTPRRRGPRPWRWRGDPILRPSRSSVCPTGSPRTSRRWPRRPRHRSRWPRCSRSPRSRPCAGGRVQVEPVPGWVEGLNLFVVVAMEPGSRKSAVHRAMLAPIVAYERLLVETAAPDIAEQRTIRQVAEAAHSRLVKAAAAAKKPDERLALEAEARTAAEALERLDVPTPPRLFTADVTPEKLASMLHENRGRMAVLSAEGGIFDLMAGRYSSGIPNLDVYLAGHAGDPIRVDRRGRSPEYVDRPALTMGLAVQPVRALAHRTQGRLHRARAPRPLPLRHPGRHGRLSPRPRPAGRGRDQPALRHLPARPRRDLRRAGRDGHAHPVARGRRALPRVAGGGRAAPPSRCRPGPHRGLVLEARWGGRAHRGAAAPRRHVHHRLGQRPSATRPWRARSRSGTSSSGMPSPRSTRSGSTRSTWTRRRVLRWVAGRATFSKRECFIAHRSRFPRASDLDAVLGLLQERGYIRAVAREAGPGRPSERYEVNPAAQNAHNVAEPGTRT